MKPKKPTSGRIAKRGAARRRPLRERSTRRDRSRPSGSTRPALRPQFDAPIEARRRTEPRTVRRLMLLGVVMALMLVVLTPALRSYLQQRDEISELKHQKVTAQAAIDSLERQRQQWQDPNYVKKQAQQRLGFSMPGQQITVYVDDSGATHSTPSAGGVTNAAGLKNHPWYGQLWGSISTSSDLNDK